MPPATRYPPGVNPPASRPGIRTGATQPHGPGQGVRRPTLSRTGPSITTGSGGGGAGAGAGAADGTGLAEAVEIEDFGPPAWRAILNRRADLGYPDFYPSRPGFQQPEDVLTEENVKNGFTAKTFVAPTAESFSMHGPIHQHLINGGVQRLNQLGAEIMQKREDAMPKIGERAFKIPVRVTYNDTKRIQFLSDLANPAIPLQRLMRNNVPHGFKGVEMFEAMFAPVTSPAAAAANRGGPATTPIKASPEPIPLDRALWFIRVLGANEIAAHRSRAAPTPVVVSAPSPVAATPSSTTTIAMAPTVTLSSNVWYTGEFTNLFTTWMRLQLVQLSLPSPATTKSAGKPALPAARAAIGVLADEKARARWIAKWEYTASLLRELNDKNLLSARITTAWMAEHLLTANLAQVSFLSQLIAAYLPEMNRHVTNSRHCIRAACVKIKEFAVLSSNPLADKATNYLRHIVKTLYQGNSEVLLSPSTWRAHSDLLRDIITLGEPGNSALSKGVYKDLADYARRNEQLMYRAVATITTSSPRRQQMEEIHKLDSMSGDTNMTELCKSFFDGTSSATHANLDLARFEEKVVILLNWAMGLFTLGIHRPYAICTLLKLWHDQRDRYLSKNNRKDSVDLFVPLYKWLDTSAAARKGENALGIGITFGELTRSGLFSYGRYLQTLISRGHTRRSRSAQDPSHHLACLRVMPIFVEARDLLQQRRLALCGDDPDVRRRDEEQEDQALEHFRDEMQEYIPEIFGYKRFRRSAHLRDLNDHRLSSTINMTRYVFLQARFWMFPLCVAHLKSRDGRPAMDGSTFARILQVLRQCYGYSTIADLVVCGIKDAENEEVLDIVIDTIQREVDAWTAIDKWARIVDALLDRMSSLKSGSHSHRRVIHLLGELARQGRLSKDDSAEVTAARQELEKANPVPSTAQADANISLPAVVQAIQRGDVAGARTLADKLFTRHGPYAIWANIWWPQIIRAFSATTADNNKNMIDAVVGHIRAVDDVGHDLNSTIATWLDGLTIVPKIELLGVRDAPLVPVFLRLVASRHLSSFNLLDKLVYPIWKHAAGICLSNRPRQSSRYQFAVENTIILAHQLLITTGPNKSLPPMDLREALVMQTSRAEVLHDKNVPNLIRHLPFLVVLLKSPGIYQKTHGHISLLLESLSSKGEFKTAAFRHLDMLKDAFLSSEWSKANNPEVEHGMVDSLKLIMSEKASGSSTKPKITPTLPALDPASRFSAWRWTRIVLEMRVEFKRLAAKIESGVDVMDAKQTLSQLVRSSLERETTADDADLLCEAFRGIEPVVTQEIVTSGLDRLTSLLTQLLGVELQDQVESLDQTIDLVLKILTASGPSDQIDLENSATSARHKLLDMVAITLQSIERHLSTDEELHLPDGIVPPQPAALFRIATKLLRYSLGLGRSEANQLTTARADFGRLAMAFLRVVATLQDQTSYSAVDMSDMLAYIVESAPPQSRPSLYTSWLSEMSSQPIQSLFKSIPTYTSALPQPSPIRRSIALQTGDAANDLDGQIALDDRPWELFELLLPPTTIQKHGFEFLSSRPIRDSAPLPLILFKPQIKREAIPDPRTRASQIDDDDEYSWQDFASERNLGDGFAGEPRAAQQSATLLFAGPEDAVPGSGGIAPAQGGLTAQSALAALSPAASTAPSASGSNGIRRRSRRMSVRKPATTTTTTATSHPFSSNNGAGTSKDAISVIDDDAEGEGESDEDDKASTSSSGIEIIDPPPPAKKARTASKTTTTTTGSGRPMTGGKAPAKKHVGGKAPARKSTGGKNVARKVIGGKAPRKR